MLLVTFLAKSFPFGSAKIQMFCTIHYSRNPGKYLHDRSLYFTKRREIQHLLIHMTIKFKVFFFGYTCHKYNILYNISCYNYYHVLSSIIIMYNISCYTRFGYICHNSIPIGINSLLYNIYTRRDHQWSTRPFPQSNQWKIYFTLMSES